MCGYFIFDVNSTNYNIVNISFDVNEVVSAVPLPAAAWMFIAGLVALFGAALGGLGFISRRRKAKAAA